MFGIQCVFYSTLVNSSLEFVQILEYIFLTHLMIFFLNLAIPQIINVDFFANHMSTLASTLAKIFMQFTIFSMQLLLIHLLN